MMKKKAMISLEALIILIAMIVIASLAAGVIIRNSGVLQQRAVTVSEQSRERLVSGFEIISMYGIADIVNENLNDLEILVRLRAGSLPIQLKNLKILFTTQDVSMSASLQDAESGDQFPIIDISNVNTSWTSIIDIEDTEHESSSSEEYIRYDGSQYLEINLSYYSNNADPDDESGTVPGLVYVDIGNVSGGTPMEVQDVPIKLNSVLYGFVSISGTPSGDDDLSGTSANITNFPVTDTTCKFDNLLHERGFCYISNIGNGDTTLEIGEIVSLRFRFKNYNALGIETAYELQLLPKEGAIETLATTTPSTLTVQKEKLWG